MKGSKNLVLGAAASILGAATISAETTTFCPSDFEGACYQWGVPDDAVKAGSGNIYFQMKAPVSHQWLGLGIGHEMKGAEIFIIYQDGKGNVTLSNRAGKGEFMPLQVQRPDVELLAGSGVTDGQMIANIRCGSSCNSLVLNGTNNWIASWKSGSPLDTTNQAAVLQEHDDHAQFHVDFSKASISSDSNPFLSNNQSNSTNSKPGSDSDGDSDGDSDDDGDSNTLPYAHGIIMTIVFVAAYPLGAFIMPLFGKWYVHASWQMLAFLVMWAGFGIGYTVAHREGIFFRQCHTGLGTVLVALISLQPILGWVHHVQYRKHNKRTISSYIHIWYGRLLIILGIINGGLGLQLAGGPTAWIITYSVVAGIVVIAYGIFGLVRDLRGITSDRTQRQKGEEGAGREEMTGAREA